ncbi:MAG: nitronate monooxygenase, partial [Clostridiales bacterium]|nr:nitronate monooxygenase [Clostridiales bacterium]
VLIDAVRGDVENGLIFCGANVGKVNKMTTVHEIFEELTKEQQ